MASPNSNSPVGLQDIDNTRTRRDRPCDACRKRKSRCVLPPGVDSCVLCRFHNQSCTFVERPPRTRKRKPEEVTAENASTRRSPDVNKHHRKASTSTFRTHQPVGDYADLKGPSLLKKTLGLQYHRHSRYIGPTTEFEPCLLRPYPSEQKDEVSYSRNGTLRRVTDRITFLIEPDQHTQDHADEVEDLDAIEQIVAPHGLALINIFFRIVHPSFPVLHKKVFLEKYERTHREFSPPLLAVVYILALNWWSYSPDLAHLPIPDAKALEQLALETFGKVIHRPKLSTIQAGLLLSQRPAGDSLTLTAQLVVMGHGLGLHLDCSAWKIPSWEKGLRKRLAWALFMQDKWSALIHGRPSQIVSSDWAVQAVSESDFPERAADEDDEEGSSEVEQGRLLFTRMITLTEILSEILSTLYTLKAIQEVELELSNGLNLILERAKPVQIKLKDWFATLPSSLRMDSMKLKKLSSTGYLHLAYYATEITLHRCIVRSLNARDTDRQLLHICRSAAKARLLSAMEFTKCLKPQHLQAFWYFCSKVNFALIGAFGTLLCATADNKEDAKYYNELLGNYKWTLRVFHTDIMESAVAKLDASMILLRSLNQQRFAAPEVLVASHSPREPDLDPFVSLDTYVADEALSHAAGSSFNFADSAQVAGSLFDAPFTPSEFGPSPDTAASEQENAPDNYNAYIDMRF